MRAGGAKVRRAPTLRGRVSVLALAVIAGWLAILAVGFDVVLSGRLDQQVEDALRVRAQAAQVTVVAAAGRVTGVREALGDTALDSSIWVYAGTRALERPPVKASVQRVADSLAGSSERFADRDDHRFYVVPIRSQGRRAGTIVAAVNLEPYERTRKVILGGSAVISVLLLLGAYPVLRYATGRALRPVERMTAQAAEWGHTAPAQRFGADQRYSELGFLAGSLDDLLDRLSALLRHERHLSAELSHELRTPLARVVAQVDLLRSGADEGQRAELDAVAENCAAMDRIIETLLAAARTELTAGVGSCEVGTVFDALSEPVGSGGPRVTAEQTTLSVGVDTDVVHRILGPVLDNARRYARTSITLRARRDPAGVAIEVANDGPAIAPAAVQRIFEAGFRAGDDEHDGAGLGLALALRLARAADGDLTVESSAQRTAFRLVLPAG